MNYSLEDFDYYLPKELIAQKPADNRGESRLLIYDRATGQITDDYFYNIAEYLKFDTTLVVNNSKVEECRLIFGSKEVFLLKTFNDTLALAMVRPGRQFKKGAIVDLTEDVQAEVTDVNSDGHRLLKFTKSLNDKIYEQYKHIPLPPYIKQNDDLKQRYQTVYAKPLGSKAAPTAGLHFSDEHLNALKKKFGYCEVTLHVGLGTFSPISDKEIMAKQLHEESFEISSNAKQTLETATHITAVGTTTLRTLESAANSHRKIATSSGSTEIFIQPDYEFRMVDSLITNFHLPKSSLLMLVAAFMGFDEMKKVYEHAVEHEYKFFSFGDAMLIL